MGEGEKVEQPTLAAVIITRNEERNISACLQSVAWADERIVVDAESTDRTVELAQAHESRVFVRPWPGFGAQKNFGFSQVRSEWILIVDADERVSPKLAHEVRATIASWTDGHAAAYRVPRRNYFYGQWVRWGGAFPDYQIRLVRNGAGRYNDVAVHENLMVDGSLGTLNGHLVHYTERTIADHFPKFQQYTTLAAEQKRSSCIRVRWYHLVANPAVIFVKTYVMKQGFRDGTRGVIFAVFASMYTFVKYGKLYERQRGAARAREPVSGSAQTEGRIP